MQENDRIQVQDEWMDGSVPVIVATSAFGMGIDKPSVRFVAHWRAPQSCSAYYQESGRAGRDGKRSYARMYWSSRDSEILKTRMLRGGNNKERDDRDKEKKNSLKAIIRYAEDLNCRHSVLSKYFGDRIPSCGDKCDICINREVAKEKLSRFFNGEEQQDQEDSMMYNKLKLSTVMSKFTNNECIQSDARPLYKILDRLVTNPAGDAAERFESSLEEMQDSEDSDDSDTVLVPDMDEVHGMNEEQEMDGDEEILMEDNQNHENQDAGHLHEVENWEKCQNCDKILKKPIKHFKKERNKDCLAKYVQTYKVGKICLNCNLAFGKRISHLKKASNQPCFELYVFLYKAKFGEKYESYDIKTLQKIFNKNENKQRWRSNPENRRQQNQNRKQQRKTSKANGPKCCNEFLQSIEDIMSRKCSVCTAFFSSRNVIEIEPKSIDHEDLIREGFIEEGDQNFVCKSCKKLKDDLDQIKQFENSQMSKDYEEWAKTHFTLKNKIKELKQIFKMKTANIGLQIENENGSRNTRLYPISNPNTVCCKIDDENQGLEYTEPTIFLPQELFDDLPNNKLSPAEGEMINRAHDQIIFNVISALILDRLGMMKTKKEMGERRNQEVKKGILKGKRLTLRNDESQVGFMQTVKGTNEFKENTKKEMVFRQFQNGKKSIRFEWKVCNGLDHALKDEHLATCLVKMRGHKIMTLDKGEYGREVRVACGDGCNPFKCQLEGQHQTPTEKLKGSDIDLLAMVKFLHEKINSFIRKIIAPFAADFSFFLSFSRPKDSGDSGFWLCGNIWMENEDMDSIPKIWSIESLKTLLGEGGGQVEVVDDLIQWDSNCYKEDEDQSVQFDEQENCGETSIIEAICCCIRNMQVKWASQSVVYINTTDPRKVR